MSVISLCAIIMATFFAALLSGSIGSGGGLLLLPILSAIVGVQNAVPMLTSIQIVSNASRAGLSWRSIRWNALFRFASVAVPATLLGSYAFVNLNKGALMHIIGTILVVLIAINFWKGAQKETKTSEKYFMPFAAAAGFLSGMIGTAGPLGPMAFLSLEMSPVEFIATDATCSLILHLVKLSVYQHSLNIPAELWATSVGLAFVTIAGSWCGKNLAKHIPAATFKKVVMGSLAVSSLMLAVR